MEFEIEYEAPVGDRLHRYFHGVTTFGGGLWWSRERSRWETYEEYEASGKGGASSHAPCKSFRAFKRHLRKHPELAKAEEVVLVSRFVDFNIIARPHHTG